MTLTLTLNPQAEVLGNDQVVEDLKEQKRAGIMALWPRMEKQIRKKNERLLAELTEKLSRLKKEGSSSLKARRMP